MANQTSKGDIQLNRSLLVGGGVLVTLGGMLGFTGMALLASALISATRQWVDQLEQPPSEIARRRWEQTKAAASAGAAAWRNGPPNGEARRPARRRVLPVQRGAIPWLLLRAVANQGDGVLGQVDFVQRIETRGEVAPG